MRASMMVWAVVVLVPPWPAPIWAGQRVASRLWTRWLMAGALEEALEGHRGDGVAEEEPGVGGAVGGGVDVEVEADGGAVAAGAGDADADPVGAVELDEVLGGGQDGVGGW